MSAFYPFTRGGGGGVGGEWVKGGLHNPYRALFAPLEVLCGTRFGSNVSLSKVHLSFVKSSKYWPSLRLESLEMRQARFPKLINGRKEKFKNKKSRAGFCAKLKIKCHPLLCPGHLMLTQTGLILLTAKTRCRQFRRGQWCPKNHLPEFGSIMEITLHDGLWFSNTTY